MIYFVIVIVIIIVIFILIILIIIIIVIAINAHTQTAHVKLKKKNWQCSHWLINANTAQTQRKHSVKTMFHQRSQFWLSIQASAKPAQNQRRTSAEPAQNQHWNSVDWR